MAGIYIHFPFCKQKCVYCSFYSVASLQRRAEYWEGLFKEMELRKDFLPEKNIDTLYIGGGTPSLCTPAELERLMEKLQQYYTFSPSAEITLEANPEQLTADYLSALKTVGINRLSIGVQSFDDTILRLLNRRHDAATALAAVKNAHAAGFDNLSIDLIYDIAYRSGEMWRQELATALWLPIVHLSCYSLTVEENTLLARRVREGQPYLPEEADTERDFLILREMTAKAGFQQYEISNFAKEGRISRHNHAYWTGEPYLGLGPAAHSYRAPVRQWNVADLKRYVEGMACGNPDIEQEVLTPAQQYDEFVLLRLRTCEGIPLQELEKKFGAGRKQQLLKQLQHVNPAHYVADTETVRLTEAGLLFADAVAEELFAED